MAASKMARFFQQLAGDADALRRFEAGGAEREALLQAAGFDAAERALIDAQDSMALHGRMMADLDEQHVQWNNNNTNNNIGKFKRPDAATLR